MGFRSHAAGGKLLQARRKGSHPFGFTSNLFGTWEQWQVGPVNKNCTSCVGANMVPKHELKPCPVVVSRCCKLAYDRFKAVSKLLLTGADMKLVSYITSNKLDTY